MVHLFASAAIAYGCAGGAWLLFRKGGSRAVCAAISIIAIAVLSPMLIPQERTILRGIAAFFAGDLIFKMVDYLRQLRRANRDADSFGDYLRFLVPFPVFLVVLELRNRRLPETPPWWPEVFKIAAGAAAFALGSVLIYLAGKSAMLQSHFALDHALKLGIVVILVESASHLMHGIERLAGYDTKPPMQYAFLSETVGEFWCRWNNRVQAWLHYNVFLPVGGRRAPIRGVVHSFFWSAVFHEVMFGVATSRFDGYQFTFFMLQIPAVLFSRRLERFAQRNGTFGKATAHLLTISWISVTSILFFHGVDRVFPFFYASEPWLP